jgi:hypothetical protein
MDDPDHTAHFDWLAANGKQGVLLNGKPQAPFTGSLPADGGIHFVAATAQLGGFESLGSVPATGSPHLSSDHRWLGFDRGDGLSLFDLKNAFRHGFTFFPDGPSWSTTIHPSGEIVAQRTLDEIRLFQPDGHVLRVAPFQRKTPDWVIDEVIFSACGRYLWFAAALKGEDDALYLLSVPSLEVLDRIPAPHDPSNCYDEDEPAAWAELSIDVCPKHDCLVASRTAGDSHLSVSFHRAQRGKIETHPYFLEGTEPFDCKLSFSFDGLAFVGHDSCDTVYRWNWPDCKRQARWYARPNENGHVDQVALQAEVVLVDMEGGIRLLGVETLEAKRSPYERPRGSLLPNGLLLTERGDKTDVQRFELRKDRVPVVAETDGGMRCVRRVFHKKADAWQDITPEVAWVEPNFDFEPNDRP